jgi:hypothetical protein
LDQYNNCHQNQKLGVGLCVQLGSRSRVNWEEKVLKAFDRDIIDRARVLGLQLRNENVKNNTLSAIADIIPGF